MDGSILSRPSPELWGGLECTVVRVNGTMRDQFQDTGHTDRICDLERVADLGIRTLRYPVGWERVAPDQPDELDWAWHDERLAELRRLGIRPILGLLHHGSGPAYTCLSDPAFPEKLAAYAARVARRYPWVNMWTPVNEPVTTARFSGLYAVWSPHRASERDFLRMLHHECRGVLLAMREIRKVNPGAMLMQTEDLGRTFGTPDVQEAVDYENGWRWLSFDLLLGRVDGAHPWRARLLAAAVPEAELDDYLVGDAVPLMLGLNHYATSERWLDHRKHLYPDALQGGDERYVDTEAVRVPMPEGTTGWLPRLREAWQRYPGVPMAVTEAHLGCTPDEQVRWLCEAHDAARQLQREGCDLRGVTVWSMLGAVDWCSLLAARRDRYEPGTFDVRGDAPRRTPLADAVESLAKRGRHEHEWLHQPGWWRREDRIHAFLRDVDWR
ncbi:MAG: family 1 glycosylhydrolase [Acetobacteraceae bacterium]|nr:family 1 glycosylhydrolase [Acetobacteraceae bacterium]